MTSFTPTRQRRLVLLTVIAAVAVGTATGCTASPVSAPPTSEASRARSAQAPGQTGSPSPSSSATSAPAPSPPAPESNPPGDIPDNQACVPYALRGNGFSVKVPEGWAQTTVPGGVRFGDKLNSIQVTRSTGRPQPTPAAVTAAVQKAEGGKAGFALGQSSTTSQTVGSAVKVTCRVDGTADPVTGKTVNDDVELYVFWRKGTEVDLRLAGPHGADNVDPWKIVTDSFRWTP